MGTVRRRIYVTGVVQGVGFRPFVYNLATRYGLAGWVCNTSAGVEIEAQGSDEQVARFIEALQVEAPPLARIDQVLTEELTPNGDTGFEIRHSAAQPGRFQPISPDVATCDACLAEVMDPRDRRYRYPFTNCTHCGPRFTIIRDIPYDRPQTTMASFTMCPECQAEYDDPTNRRFHAQPNACPACGPQVTLVPAVGRSLPPGLPPDPIEATRALLTEGFIVAVKGIGGFHLACDARNEEAVRRLRERKGRAGKPFALMVRDLEAARRLCEVSPEEAKLLLSRERPILLLRARPEHDVAPSVAPRQRNLGMMLPYTPLHHLLLAPGAPDALVMTSGNISEEPIITDNDEALRRLSPIADAFLMHNRDIYMRCDDSVVRVFRGAELPIRRSRGYAPYPVHLGWDAIPLLACGGELKNTFCVTRGPYAFLSQHIGDMENLQTLEAFEKAVTHFERLFRISPEAIACDLHPDYLATRYAQQRAEREGLPLIGVQHHHAHVAACLAEHQASGPAIGVAFDGTGYGDDGAIWGGEFLIADLRGYRRAAHLAYVPLPGGDAAVRRVYRIAWSHLAHAYGSSWPDLPALRDLPADEERIVRQQLDRGINAPPTSSMGRLFDAVSSLCGICQHATYEGQAAIELEMASYPSLSEASTYPWPLGDPPETGPWALDTAPLIRAIVEDLLAGTDPAMAAARFHHTIAQMVADVCLRLRERFGLNEVALSGGVWQNTALLELTVDRLAGHGFQVYTHRLVPPNDGGLSLGQAVVADQRLRSDGSASERSTEFESTLRGETCV